VKSNKQNQENAKNSMEQTITNQQDHNTNPQADGFRYEYDDSSDVK
jgi:hypothetical protein